MGSYKVSLTSFKDLGRVLEKSRGIPHEKKTASSVKKTEEQVFHEAMADVREIPEFREIPLRKPRKKHISVKQSDDTLNILRQITEGRRKITLADTGEYIEWMSPRVRKDLAQRLHHGNFAVQDAIDLHGMTLREAEEAMHAFIREALQKRLFCVKVVHGRGLRSPHEPVLKEAVKSWLQGVFRKWVLAFSTAKDTDGGLGATYILLR
ncbi:MAG: Smr/MutS family protein [Nitrospirota bacterium]